VAKRTFRELATEILREANTLISAEELAERMNERGYRKQNGEKIDAQYVALRAKYYFETFFRLRRQ